MSQRKTLHLVWTASILLASAALIACNQTSGNTTTAAASDGKLPITTRSDEARQEFLQGRDLSERLLGQESLQHFDKALSIDPEFASGGVRNVPALPKSHRSSAYMSPPVPPR